MGNPSVPDLDIDPAEFETTYNDHVVVTKSDRDDAGNVRTAWPSSMIASRFTAEWGNFVDDTLRALQQLARGPARIGTAGDLSADPQATMNWDATNLRVRLRNAANSAFRDLQIGNLFFSGGPRIITRDGSPEGAEVAGSGSVCLDYSTDDGRVWKKTTSSGNTGWVELGAGGKVTQTLGWTAASNTLYYLPFGNNSESGTLAAQHLYRVPIAGTVSRVSIVSQNDLGATDLYVRDSAGSDLGSVSGVTGSAEGSFFVSTYVPLTGGDPVAVAAGDVIALALDTTNNSGQTTAVLEIDP